MIVGMHLRPSYPVRTHRLLLRPLRETDVDALVAYRSLPEVCRWVPFEPMTSEAVRERLQGAWSRRTLEQPGEGVILGIEIGASGELVGDANVYWESSEHRSGEIGYVLNPRHGGQGYATEAAHAVLHLAFDALGLHRVIARVDAENLPSARVAQRLGMRQEAHLIENEWFKGHWSDELQFALLDREWRAQHESGCPFGATSPQPGKAVSPGRFTGSAT